MSHFENVKNYILELGYSITSEDEKEELVVIDDESEGIKHLVIDCEDPILILEQFIFNTNGKLSDAILLRLLQMNRSLVHGAFAIDDAGEKVIFRDTLQLENLDLNELEGSIHALSRAMAEHGEELVKFARG